MTKRSNQGLQNKALKLRYLDTAKKAVEQLQDENEKLKSDPNTLIGQIIPQLREAISQNKKLSVLAAALIDTHGGSITVSKEALESFESKVLSIKWAIPEGVEGGIDAATELTFSYEALTQEEVAARQAEQSQPPSITIAPELDREQMAEKFIKESGKTVHASDCSTSIAPAEVPGPCDCTVEPVAASVVTKELTPKVSDEDPVFDLNT